jgi:hypothetical protein
MRAKGLSLCFLTAASEATTTAAAPSQMPEALPALTVPLAMNSGLSLDRVAKSELGLGCSSTSNLTS